MSQITDYRSQIAWVMSDMLHITDHTLPPQGEAGAVVVSHGVNNWDDIVDEFGDGFGEDLIRWEIE